MWPFLSLHSLAEFLSAGFTFMRFKVMAHSDGSVEVIDTTLGTRKSVKMEFAGAADEAIAIPDLAKVASFKVCSVPTAA